VDEQRRDRHPLQILGEVRLGELRDAIELALERALHAHAPERVAQALRHLGVGAVGAVEGLAQVLEELRAIRRHAGPDPIEHEREEQRGEIVRVRVHVVARPRLAGAPVPAAIVGDDAVPVLREEHHLVLPRVGVQGPTVREGDRASGARRAWGA